MAFARACLLLPVLLFPAACSSGSSPSPGSSLTFSVSTPLGSASFRCADGGSVRASTEEGLKVACNFTSVGPDGGASVRQAWLELTTYEGSGTYAFQGSSDSNNSAVSFTLGDDSFGTQEATPVSPASSCNVTVTGPASRKVGSQVTGTFHCDSVFVNGVVDGGPGGFVSVDGQFGGVTQ